MILVQVNKIVFIPLLSSLVFAFTSGAAKASLSTDYESERIITQIYSSQTIALTKIEKELIKDLIVALIETPKCEQVCAAAFVINKLKSGSTKATFPDNAQTQENMRKEHLRSFVLEHYIDHLESFIAQQTIECGYLDRIRAYAAMYSIKFIQTKSTERLTQLLLEYLKLEFNQILLIPSRAHSFLRRQQSSILPSLINFWQDRSLQEKLLLRINRLSPEVVAQFFEEILVIGMQSILFGGSSMYNNWISEQAQKQFEEFVKQQNKIQADFSAYLKKLSDEQNSIAKAIIQGFSKAQSDLQKQFAEINTQQKQEIAYLLRSLNLVIPIDRYLSSPPVSYDQLFEASIMYTPGTSQWYNIFQMQQTNWEYNASSNSFMQYDKAPFTTPYWIDNTTGFDPAQSSIFTGYIAPKRSYELEIELTLINCTYPYFAGITFNRGRWISADPEKMSQYRLLGFYGQLPSGQKSPDITLHFAEQKIDVEKNIETIISPFEQIMKDPKTNLAKIPQMITTQLDRDPQTFILSIQAQPQAITYTVTHKKANNQLELLASGTVSNLSKNLGLHSGIGFMAIGCQASFKINKPTELIYSSDQIKPFLETMQKLIGSFSQNTGGAQ